MVLLSDKGHPIDLTNRAGVTTDLPLRLGHASPFALSRGKIVQIAEKLCPVDWEIDREAERQVSCVIREFQEEWFAYDELVSDWNSGSQLDRSLSAFVTFTVAWVEELTRLVPTE